VEAAQAAEKKARSRNVEISTDLDRTLPRSNASPSELQQVLSNLLNNALDACGPQGRIEVSSRLEDGEIVLEVRDNGQGIPAEILSRVFDPFFTTKPVGKGTGLGLSICYGIVKKLGGVIGVKSVAGVLTTFRIRLPLQGPGESPQVAAQASTEPSAAERQSVVDSPAPTPTSVLVVDDEAGFVDAVCRRLARRGFEVSSATSGAEALEKVEAIRQLDVVVLDVKMPGMDGIETLSEIKLRRPLVEIILLSGHTTVEWVIEGMRLGAFNYLMKPLDIAQLIEYIDQAKAKKSEAELKSLEARLRGIATSRW